MFGREHQVPAAAISGPRRRRESARGTAAMRSFFGSAVGSTITGPLASASRLPWWTWLLEHGHFRQPGFQQVAAAQAGGFALRRNADFDVETIALLDARPQDSLAPAPATRCRRPARRWDWPRRGSASLPAARRVAATDRDRCPCRASRDQPDRLDLRRLHAGGTAISPTSRVCGFGRLGLLRALRPHRRPVEPGTSPEPIAARRTKRNADVSCFPALCVNRQEQTKRKSRRTIVIFARRVKREIYAESSETWQ